MSTQNTTAVTGRFLSSLDQIPHQAPVSLYGVGETGEAFAGLLARERPDLQIVSFIDSFKSGRMSGIEIIRADQLPERRAKFGLIIVCSVFWNQIEKGLKQAGIDDFTILSNYFVHRTSPLVELGDYYFGETELRDCRSRLDSATELLTGEEDRRLHRTLIDIRCRGDLDGMEYLKDRNYDTGQYLEHVNYKEIKTIIEGGVFDGADTKEFYGRLPDDGFIYGFEPFYDLFVKGKHRSFFEDKPNVKILPLALWHCKEKLKLSPDGESASASSVGRNDRGLSASLEVDAISIDDFVKENDITKVDFIKMDIEGAEMDVLEGARRTIFNHRPQLALSIYHKKEHLYEIPLFLADLVADYEYRIGQYTPTFVDTVWYAIPGEIAGR